MGWRQGTSGGGGHHKLVEGGTNTVEKELGVALHKVAVKDNIMKKEQKKAETIASG